MTELTVEEQQGVKVIQHLQSLVGIDESDEDALIGWRKMSKGDKKFTLEFYNSLSKKETKQ